jgi:ADP-ribosyl-[dinitrogen reductase] hydrolase
MTLRERILGGLWGSLVGDALGVPVEFKDRAIVQADPVRDMRGYGTHHQPPGTWSDDGALLLCTVDSLVASEFDMSDMGRRFVEWVNRGLWTATGEAFDIGMATSDALFRIEKGTPPEQAGGAGEYDNGNGSLMRILPVALRFAENQTTNLINRLERGSSLTHRHPRSTMACALHGLFVRDLLAGINATQAMTSARNVFVGYYSAVAELHQFERLLKDDFATLSEGVIVSTGYVLHTLHASVWCLLNTTSYESCVLKAVNLGGDTDTTGCVAGGLAGILYGVNAIPLHWRNALARREDVATLFERFADLTQRETKQNHPAS